MNTAVRQPLLPAARQASRNTRRRARRTAVAKQIDYIVLPKMNEATARDKPKRGETIRRFVDRTGWERRGLPMICVEVVNGEGVPVLRKDWERKIRAKDNIFFLARPLGGGGGNRGQSAQIGAIVAMVALVAIAAMLTAGAGGGLLGGGLASAAGFGSGATWGAIASAVIVAGGSMLISHFLTPKAPKDDNTGQTYTAWLGGNQARPQQSIPVHYGKLKFNPDFSAAPWSDFDNQDQFFHGLYTIGAGEFQIHEIGVEETPIWNENTGNSVGFSGFQYEIVPPSTPVALFPINVVSSPNVSGQEFADPYNATDNIGPHGETSGIDWVGPFALNPAGTSGSEIGMDILFGGGCYFSDANGEHPAFQDVQFQYRYIDNAGVPIGGVGAPFITFISERLQFQTTKPLRLTKRYILPAPGRVEVRGGVSVIQFRTNGTNVLTWVSARMFIAGANVRPKVTQLAIRVKGDKQFSGYSQRSLYVIATRKLPVWNGTSFVLQATRNPIAAYIDLWSNSDYAASQPTSKCDMITLAQEQADADARGDTFNHRFTSRISLMEALETVARVILAKPRIVWDTLSIVRDKPRDIPKLMLTDFQIIRGSLQIIYPLMDADTADGTVVEYLEEQIWKAADAPSNDDITTLVNPARVQIPGITNRRQAFVASRYLALCNRYRRKTITVDVEAEGQMLFFGDFVCLSTELPQRWGQSLIINSYDPITRKMVFHAPVEWAPTGDHFVRVRRRSGKPFGPVKISRGSNDAEGIINAFDLASVEDQQDFTLVNSVTRLPGDEPPTCSFSIAAPRDFLGLVSGVRSLGDSKFRLSLASYAPEVYGALSAPTPPLPSVPPIYIPRVPGQIGRVDATLIQVGALLQLSASWPSDLGSDRYQAQITATGGTIGGEPTEDVWTTVYSGVEAAFIVSGLGDNDYRLRVRGVRQTAGGQFEGLWKEVLVETPGLDLSPNGLNVQIGYIDLDQSLFDATFTGPNRAMSDAMIAALGEAVDRKQADYSLATANASIVREQTVITGTLGAMAFELEEISASVGNVSANGSIKFSAVATPVGADAAWELFLSATGPTGAYSSTGMRFEANSDGTSRVVVSAAQFMVQNPVTQTTVFGTAPDGSFILQGVGYVANSIKSTALTGGGQNKMVIDFVNGSITVSD